MIAISLTFAVVLAAVSGQAVDFNTQIIPILTKAGCNAGACHGAAAGRGGLRLSLLGSDPAFDYESIVHDREGRRVNLARPDASLILAKPTGVLDHGGDVPLDSGSDDANLLATWIRSGVPRGKARRLVQFDVHPQDFIADRTGAQVSLKALARLDDRHDSQNVTAWTVFTSADPTAVEISAKDLVATVRRHGQHVVIARYLDRVVPIQLTLPFSAEAIDPAPRYSTNFIDEEISKKLRVLRLPASAAADDGTLIRRLHLDLVGRLPSRENAEAYISDRAPDKRGRWVERLLQSESFADYWALRFARVFHVHSLPNDKQGARTYYSWLRRQIHDGTPWNVVAHELLTATGDTREIGPANFARMVSDARGHAELVSQAFLGVRLQCANCHNHPLDRWTQDDYHGLAAVFARLDRSREVAVTTRGAVTNLRTGDAAVPRIPGEYDLDPQSDCRDEFSRWLTDRQNRYFAKATVNRIWHAFFGRGLVTPMDDMRDTNPATHPELLDRLAADFVQHDFDLRHTLRLITMSETYGRGSQSLPGNAMDDRFYSHANPRSLEPEVLADAIADVTGVADEYSEGLPGTRAVNVFDPLMPAPSLDILGRCSRAADCDQPTSAGGLPAKLHLLNGELINRKLIDRQSRLQQALSANESAQTIVCDFYWRAFSRPPTSSEAAFWSQSLADSDPSERANRFEDFVWSLLNCREFTTNH